MQLADRIANQERQEHERRDRAAAAAETWARSRPRRVTLREDEMGTHLTIHGLSWKPGIGWLLVLFGVPIAALGVFSLAWLALGFALAIPGAVLLASPRSTLHLLAAREGFAVYTTRIDRPHYVGLHRSLEVSAYEWRGSTGIHVRVWNAHYWSQTYMGIAHPDDFRLVEAFNAKRGRR